MSLPSSEEITRLLQVWSDGDREAFDNCLAAPLNFRAVNVSSPIPLESIPFVQYDLEPILPDDAQPLTVLPAVIEGNILSPAVEAQIVGMEDRSAQESEIAAQSKVEEEGRGELPMFTMNSETERPENEFAQGRKHHAENRSQRTSGNHSARPASLGERRSRQHARWRRAINDNQTG